MQAPDHPTPSQEVLAQQPSSYAWEVGPRATASMDWKLFESLPAGSERAVFLGNMCNFCSIERPLLGFSTETLMSKLPWRQLVHAALPRGVGAPADLFTARGRAHLVFPYQELLDLNAALWGEAHRFGSAESQHLGAVLFDFVYTTALVRGRRIAPVGAYVAYPNWQYGQITRKLGLKTDPSGAPFKDERAGNFFETSFSTLLIFGRRLSVRILAAFILSYEEELAEDTKAWTAAQ